MQTIGEFNIDRLARRLKDAYNLAKKDNGNFVTPIIAASEYSTLTSLAYIHGYGVDRDRIYIYLGDNTRKYVS